MSGPVTAPGRPPGHGTASRSACGQRAPPGPAWRVLALAAVIIFPLAFTNQQVATIAFLTLIFVCAAVAWNLFSGYSGYISLGHAVFFGSGAYAAGIAARDWQITGSAEFALLPLAAVVAALIAVPFGLIALRVRRHTFVVITIAIFFIFQLMAFNLNSFTNGTIGLNAPFLLWDPVSFDQRFYYMALVLALGTVAISWLIKGSRFGLQLRAIRDDEDRAASLGRAGHAGQADRLRDLRRDHRPGRSPVVLLHQPGPAAVRLRPAVRPDRRADGVPRRARHRQPARCSAR